MKLALVPLNIRIGDPASLQAHQDSVKLAVQQGASLIVFPELSLIGYPSQDLLHRSDYLDFAEKMLADFHLWLQKAFPKVAVVVGCPLRVEPSSSLTRGLANCAVFLQGERKEIRAKTLIPFYDIFHESRYFDSAIYLPASYRAPIEWNGRKLGLLVCEDSWHDTALLGRKAYTLNPTKYLCEQGCDFLINTSASPYAWDKQQRRRDVIRQSAQENKVPIAYVNCHGAQDDILFDGDAFVISPEGDVFEGPLWDGEFHSPKSPSHAEQMEKLRQMLVLGIRDYCEKNGFSRVVLGLSGGLDSALVATLAAQALGSENVIGLCMPSKYSSVHSVEDAEALAENLKIRFHHLPIKMPHSTFSMALKPFFEGMPEDVTEENLQSRLRGVMVMAFSNKFSALALATGNKSEFSMGYSTLYGDMCGALAPIGDMYKTKVYELCHYLNKQKEVIPSRTLTKAPSAELRPNQTDQDTLPPYEELDAILECLVEGELDIFSTTAHVRQRFPHIEQSLVRKVQRSLRLSEYKRKQAPPILRLTSKAFGSGRVYPLTCGFPPLQD